MQYKELKESVLSVLNEDKQANDALLAGKYEWLKNQSGMESSGRYTETGKAWQFPKITRSHAPQRQRYSEKPRLGRAEDFAQIRGAKDRFKALCDMLKGKNLHSLREREFEEIIGEIRNSYYRVKDEIDAYHSHRGFYERGDNGESVLDQDTDID